jgi:peptidoglycan/LPS O-acetylase OafA/YrhL
MKQTKSPFTQILLGFLLLNSFTVLYAIYIYLFSYHSVIILLLLGSIPMYLVINSIEIKIGRKTKILVFCGFFCNGLLPAIFYLYHWLAIKIKLKYFFLENKQSDMITLALVYFLACNLLGMIGLKLFANKKQNKK